MNDAAEHLRRWAEREGQPWVEAAVEMLARDSGLCCRRIQFVPDMQPSDLIGKDQMPFKTGLVFTYDSGDFGKNIGFLGQIAHSEDFLSCP